MTTAEYEATIESLQQELKTMREERDSLKKKLEDLGSGDIDEEVRNLIAGQYERAKRVLLEHKEGHAQLAQKLIDKEVIFAEDLEEIFGKRPWTSRTDEILAANPEDKDADNNGSSDAADHKKENEEFIRQKIVQAVIAKAEKAKEQGHQAKEQSPTEDTQTDKPETT